MAELPKMNAVIDEAMGRLAAALADEQPDASQPICVGWVLVAEWTVLDGDRWITQLASPTTSWQREGYLYHALNQWQNREET